ncbi:hypothetical protein [Paracoccus sulfuroxidans]|uniref:Uncharacterized protein n=1 Tax=Paracoccus sulfuroxidans TaxID=384678 RepID=A0A562NL91_9RHOB|nr:hypothetical protein [Paracoccus sulfuroxidans]TWI32761.1 hypothetical protein IQ24_02636 [Paracoccus sulfuroxidans]
MNAQTPQTNWQSIGDLVAALAQKETRQRANAPGDDRQTQKENGDE